MRIQFNDIKSTRINSSMFQRIYILYGWVQISIGLRLPSISKSNYPVYIDIWVTRFGPKMGQIGPQMGQIRDFFRSDFSTFWRGSHLWRNWPTLCPNLIPQYQCLLRVFHTGVTHTHLSARVTHDVTWHTTWLTWHTTSDTHLSRERCHADRHI